jgi:hypothetical protein
MDNLATTFSRLDRIRLTAYCTFTLLVVFENAAGLVWFVLKIDYLRVSQAHLTSLASLNKRDFMRPAHFG